MVVNKPKDISKTKLMELEMYQRVIATANTQEEKEQLREYFNGKDGSFII